MTSYMKYQGLNTATTVALLFATTAGLGLCSFSNALELPPKFVVDLDKAPALRWKGAAELIISTHGWENSFGAAFAAHNNTLFKNLNDTSYHILGTAVTLYSAEQALELQSIAQELSTIANEYVSFEYLSAWVWFHELAHTELATQAAIGECTAIITQNSFGQVIHGRNMDQSPSQVRNVTLEMTFVKNNAVVFRAVDWYWFTTGIVTAMKPGIASLQENWRFASVTSDSVFEAAMHGVTPQVWEFREVFTNESITSFDQVAKAVCNGPLGAPDYIAVAGVQPFEGMICARTPTGNVWKKWLNESSPAFPLLIQTNYDSCAGEPANDPRCETATRTITNMGETVGTQYIGIFATLSTYPVHNPDTAYTAMMSAKDDYFVTFVRDALQPVPPTNVNE